MPKKSVEKRAIDFVIIYEKRRGRNPKVLGEGRGYDILSSGRKIEVKGVSKHPAFIQFSQYNFRALQRESNFWLYIVYNLGEIPKLLILSKNEVLKRAKFQYLWEIPFWKKDFSGPRSKK